MKSSTNIGPISLRIALLAMVLLAALLAAAMAVWPLLFLLLLPLHLIEKTRGFLATLRGEDAAARPPGAPSLSWLMASFASATILLSVLFFTTAYTLLSVLWR